MKSCAAMVYSRHMRIRVIVRWLPQVGSKLLDGSDAMQVAL